MQKYFKLLFISLSIVVLSGCSFGDTAKKTEIKLDEKQGDKVQEEVSPATDNAAGADKLSQDSADPSLGDSASQKIKTPVEASWEASAPQDKAAPSASDTSKMPKIIDRLVNWGFKASSGRKIDTIIIHSSYNAVGSDEHDLDDIINKEYKPAGVSSHYIIARDGKIYRLVEDKNIAYHAGVSKVPDGRTNVNDFSLGIEVVETKSESPSSAQYTSLRDLLSYLKGQYKIRYVLGHSDIASGRKDDPWNFDWGKIK